MFQISSSVESIPESQVQTYCSWCFKKTIHRLIKRNTAAGDIYRCSSCEEITTECIFCENMARVGMSDNGICAEHSGAISNFARFDMKISNIKDYELVFKRDSVELKKNGIIAAIRRAFVKI